MSIVAKRSPISATAELLLRYASGQTYSHTDRHKHTCSLQYYWGKVNIARFPYWYIPGRWRSAAGKVIVGLTSHWPCVTDFSGLGSYVLKAYERQMSTPPVLQ